MLDAENFKANSESIKTIIITYHWKEHNKINGSLFYCFEHFLFYKKYGYDCILSIVGISNEDIIIVEEAYKDKYQEKYADTIKEYIRYYSSIVKWAQKNDEHHIHVILDIYTLIKVQLFIQKNQKFIYVNNDYSNNLTNCPTFACKNINNANWFWYYDYQYLPDFKNRIKTTLKLGLEFQKKYKQGDEIFISTVYDKDKDLSEKYDKSLYILKKSNQIIPDLFDKINSVIIMHDTLDTNNRIIAEAFYHNKKVTVDNYYTKYDSVTHRYELGLTGQLDKITLNTDCLMFQKITDCYNN